MRKIGICVAWIPDKKHMDREALCGLFRHSAGGRYFCQQHPLLGPEKSLHAVAAAADLLDAQFCTRFRELRECLRDLKCVRSGPRSHLEFVGAGARSHLESEGAGVRSHLEPEAAGATVQNVGH